MALLCVVLSACCITERRCLAFTVVSVLFVGVLHFFDLFLDSLDA